MKRSDAIDFVIPWVDGGDPLWVAKKARYSGESTANGNEAARFRDWDILKYWFRAVEAYAPWVRYVFFVTDDQKPEWLNVEHPKLKWIKHTDYIPEEYLPTFSSRTIELNFHRIPELSEHFVYFNDDVFLNAPVVPNDFFRNGMPCYSAILDFMAPPVAGDAYIHAMVNCSGFINKYFEKRKVMQKNIPLWFSLKYGKGFLRNLYYSPTRNFSTIRTGHVSSSMLKSTYEKVWELEPELLYKTSCNRFRALSDVNQHIMTYYNICSGKFAARSLRFGACWNIETDDKKMFDDIRHGRHKVICINDHPGILDFEGEKAKLIALLESKFPKKSSFEL